MSAGKTPAEVSRGYDRVAEEYAALEGEERPWPRMRWLHDLLARLDNGAEVLDLGCGNGVPATQALAKRHRVVGVDISERQVEWARRNVPGAEFQVGDAATLELPPGSFDAVVSLYMLGHLPRSEHAALLRRTFAWLRAGGYLLMSVEEEDDPDNVRSWLGTPMFFSSFDAGTVLRMVEEAGFELLAQEAAVQIEGGDQVPFRWILARKPQRRSASSTAKPAAQSG